MFVRGHYFALVMALAVAFGFWAPAGAQNEIPKTLGQFPQIASLKRSEVNVRAGPGTRYPILWVFQRQGWPVQLLAKYDNWYKIKDIEGEEGWVYLGMVSSKKTAVVSPGEPVVMHKREDGTRPVYRLEEGVVVGVESCTAAACKIDIKGTDGWVPQQRLVSFIK